MRRRLGDALFAAVAGPDGHAARERIHGTPGPRWFPAGSPITRVHGDASMFVGGLRALLLQSLHPAAMAAVAAHSGYRSDPWGRLARTSTFLAVTTFGVADDAQAAVDRVRGIHDRIRGRAADGTRYAAGDPTLLTWVHAAEADSFLLAHQRYGARPLDDAGADAYLAQAAQVARALGAQDPPTSRAELARALDGFRPALRGTDAARETARFLLDEPPVPRAGRAGYAVLAAAAIELLPPWARAELGLPDRTGWRARGAALGGELVTRSIRWVLPPPPAAAPPTPQPLSRR